MLERVAEAVGAEIPDNQAPGEQLHHLTNELRAWVGVLPDEHTEYEERLHRQRSEVAAPLFTELLRLHNFVAICGEYLAVEPTAERFLEVLGRLQKEVLGRVRHAAPLRAIVQVAPPIRLEEHRETYREYKRKVVGRITDELEGTVRGMLHDLRCESTPLRTSARAWHVRRVVLLVCSPTPPPQKRGSSPEGDSRSGGRPAPAQPSTRRPAPACRWRSACTRTRRP